jgi:hypothetical protein
MTEDEKMFTCVKSGMNIKINPRNASGWRALGLWMAAFLAVLGLFLLGMDRTTSAAMHGGMTVLFVLATAIWAIAMIRWMMARSEMIDVKELLAIKRELDRQKRGGR